MLFPEIIPKEVKINGYTKNLKQAAEEIGFPGKPKKTLFLFLNFANKIGFPGLIKAPLKKLLSLNFSIISGTKSNLPFETAPDVIIISVSVFKFLIISL